MKAFLVLSTILLLGLSGTESRLIREPPASTCAVEEKDIDQERIVNGIRISIKERNFQIALIVGSYLCGGSLIRPDVVVTAGHCAYRASPADMKVRAGSDYYFKGGDMRLVEKAVVHPHYDHSTLANDVAVLKLKSPFTLSSTIRTIRMATQVPAGGQGAYVSGFGATVSGGSASVFLRVAHIKVIDYQTCHNKFGAALKPMMLCAGVEGKDSCQGDSGGPLTHDGTLLGIVSWGYGCANPNYPGVYTSVPVLRSWVLTVIESFRA